MKKVLVLEDEANIRSFVVINLKRAGYEAIEAESGEEALAQLKRNPDIKVALLDIMLPDMDGFEVCRRSRPRRQPARTATALWKLRRRTTQSLQPFNQSNKKAERPVTEQSVAGLFCGRKSATYICR